MRYAYSLLCVILSFSAVRAQGDDYVNDNVLKYDDYIYKPGIRTVQFHEKSWEYAAPIIAMGRGEQLSFSFDDLQAENKQYSITFIHCNADWTPSNLMQGEYLNGFYDINILNFVFSMNTYQKYAHYEIDFPQQGLQFTKSGNYLLCVYLNGDHENIVISRRFMVYDEKVQMGASVRQTPGKAQFSKQQVDLTLSGVNYELSNPYRDLQVVLMQNNRWDNAVRDLQPTFVNGSQLVYSLDEKSSFNGGNEFRYFDCRSLRFLTERVKNIYRDDDLKNHIVLHTDEVRATKPYLFYNDLNGSFQIRNTESGGSAQVEADYVYVDFFLSYPQPLSTGNLYVIGKLTDWRMNKLSKMTYNEIRLGYEAKLYLKQGYYNYMYVQSKDGSSAGDETYTEGSFWDTENDYYILVYHRKFGAQYDQLIGYRKLNSLKR
jgi:hypothetical protein